MSDTWVIQWAVCIGVCSIDNHAMKNYSASKVNLSIDE